MPKENDDRTPGTELDSYERKLGQPSTDRRWPDVPSQSGKRPARCWLRRCAARPVHKPPTIQQHRRAAVSNSPTRSQKHPHTNKNRKNQRSFRRAFSLSLSLSLSLSPTNVPPQFTFNCLILSPLILFYRLVFSASDSL